jgi:hypothetical protein
MIDESETITAAMAAFLETGLKVLWRGYQELRRRIALPGDRPDLVKQLFLDQGNFLFHPSSNWSPAIGQSQPPPVETGYPHDIQALWSFEPFLPAQIEMRDSLIFPSELMPTTRLVCAGSPKANRFTRQFLPSYAVTTDSPELQYRPVAIAPERLTYLFGEDLIAPKVNVVSMMHTNTLQAKTRKVIWRWHRGSLIPWSPIDYERKGMLNKDFLLISRLPRTRAGGDVLVLAGGHGAGTQAVSQFLHELPIRQLRELVDLVGGAPYFQFVLEVSDLRHEQSGTVARRVELSQALPPVRLDVTSRDLASATKS